MATINTPNPNDGTIVGVSDTIADEYIDATTGGRGIQRLPIGAYKLPRSKIAIGQYGVDNGDATQDTPLYVESAAERRLAEFNYIQQHQAYCNALRVYARETITPHDSRGLSTRGVR